MTSILGVREDLEGARQLIATGIKNGAPALPLYLSLAEAAKGAGNAKESKAALASAKAEVEKLVKNAQNPPSLYIALADGARRAGDREMEMHAVTAALESQPRSPETLMRLAGLYLEKQNFSRATLYLNRVASINPDSADVYYRIAQAEEGQYRFAAAGQAYARALELAPQNEAFRSRYEAFKERVEKNRPVEQQGAGKGIANCGLRNADCPTPVTARAGSNDVR
jgi:predicted Zn-dependent protease